jgi:hypothetical protein
VLIDTCRLGPVVVVGRALDVVESIQKARPTTPDYIELMSQSWSSRDTLHFHWIA